MRAKRSNSNVVWMVLVALLLAAAGFLFGRFTGDSMQLAEGQVAIDEQREVAYWRAPMDPTEIYDKPGKSRMGMDLIPVYADEQETRQADDDKGEIVYWRAPMDPTEIYEGPGKSRMGMDLIPVYAGDVEGASGIVTIDPATVQNMGVRMEKVTRTDFSHAIRTVGQVEYNEETLYLVNTKISGWIEKLHVRFTGEFVRKGDPLLEIYSPELVATQEEFLLALRNHEQLAESSVPAAREDAEQLLASSRKRLEYWDIPASEIEKITQSGQGTKTVLLRAPATGTVVHKNAVEGARINAGMDLYQIADLSTVWVHASVYDNELPWISEGQRAEVALSYLPGKTYQGRVSYVYPYLREKARDVHVRLELANPNLEIKPGMYVNVHLEGKTMPRALVIPSEAVIRSGRRTIVFVVREQGKFEPREIRIGEEGGPDNRYVRVLSGLLEGEEIVISAQFMLDSESRLQEAIQKMLREKSEAASEEPTPIPASDASEPMPDMNQDDEEAHQH